jgi:hypothetical protein
MRVIVIMTPVGCAASVYRLYDRNAIIASA